MRGGRVFRGRGTGRGRGYEHSERNDRVDIGEFGSHIDSPGREFLIEQRSDRNADPAQVINLITRFQRGDLRAKYETYQKPENLTQEHLTKL